MSTKLFTTGKIRSVPVTRTSTINCESVFACILLEFSEITGVSQLILSEIRDVKHNILTTSPPIAERPRRLASENPAAAKAKLKCLVELSICRPSSSPWTTLIHLVR